MRGPSRSKPVKRETQCRAGSDARVQVMSAALKQCLRTCTRREIELLTRYYAGGEDEKTVLAHTKITAEEFARLRRKLKRTAASAGTEQPPRTNAATAG